MSYQYLYEPRAIAEHEDGVEWYLKRSEVAAQGFIDAVRERINDLCSDPYRYRNPYSHFREVSLKKYPYYIVYHIDENRKTIIVSSIYHGKRNPERKYRR